MCTQIPTLRGIPRLPKICDCIGTEFVIGKSLDEFNAAASGEGPHADAFHKTLERCSLVY
jgi:hypothetical protein